MDFDWDEQTAIYLSLAPAEHVWRLLDRFSAERFARTLTAKRGLARLSDEQIEHYRQAPFFDLHHREISTDSSRGLIPGAAISTRQLPWIPPLVKVSDILRQLSPPVRERVLSALQPQLAALLRERIRQNWKFTPEARQQLILRARFDRELFECFGKRSPSAVAEWLIDRLFFGMGAVASLCEIHPLLNREARKHSGLRHRLKKGGGCPLDRCQQLAIVLMSLPPEVSAQLFKVLTPEVVQQVTLSISRLPPISPELRERVISEVTDLSLEDLEATARLEAEEFGQFLKRYLEGE
ncbi:MAG: hypothetical protein KF760_10885 [Candidatus Eremiobacteraeota bacterium]|nr:hypothetical protein [Candidatus Eremiobacteraeota bacterium]MCW5867237.1 hypothetical protein [Candidatus Eremiobacteraeota bacterium]